MYPRKWRAVGGDATWVVNNPGENAIITHKGKTFSVAADEKTFDCNQDIFEETFDHHEETVRFLRHLRRELYLENRKLRSVLGV